MAKAPDPNGEINVYRFKDFVIVQLIDEEGISHKMVLEPTMARDIATSMLEIADRVESHLTN